MEWMIKEIEDGLAGIRGGVPIRERLSAMRGPRLRWWLWQVYALSVGMTRAASRAVSRVDGDGMVHFGNLCSQARSWMSTTGSMASIVSIAAVRARGPANVAESTAMLADGLILGADAGNELESVVSVGLVAELSMCAIVAAVDAAPEDVTGGISAGRSSYWSTAWPADVVAPIGKIDPDSPDGKRMSEAARKTLRLFEDVASSWQVLDHPWVGIP